jgi:hypothetical protein
MHVQNWAFCKLESAVAYFDALDMMYSLLFASAYYGEKKIVLFTFN